VRRITRRRRVSATTFTNYNHSLETIHRWRKDDNDDIKKLLIIITKHFTESGKDDNDYIREM
jgi:hypothetical protein